MELTKQSKSGSGRIGYMLRMYPRFSQTFVVNEIVELESQGLDVSIASLRKPTDGVFHDAICRVKARAHYFPESHHGQLRSLARAQWKLLKKNPKAYREAVSVVRHDAQAEWFDLGRAAQVLRWAKKQGVRHIHVHFGTSEATVAMLANILGGLSYSLTLHAFDIFRDNVDRRLLARKINRSTFTVTVTEFNKRFMVENLPGVDPDKIRVNYNGIDLERFAMIAPGADQPSVFGLGGLVEKKGFVTLKHLSRVDPDKIRVNYNGIDLERFPASDAGADGPSVFGLGRLVEKKGFIDLIRAIRRLRDEGLLVRCRIAGDGPEEARLREEIERCDLGNLVELIGPVNEKRVHDLMHRSSCFVLPCIQARDGNVDALPTVLLEAIASGCPVVTTRLSGCPEIVEDRVSGLLVEPGDDAALAQAIRAMVTDRELASRLATGGRRRAEERFDLRQNVAIMHEWLTEAGSMTRRNGKVRTPKSKSSVEPALSPAMERAY